MKINRERIICNFIKLTSIDSPSFGEREMADFLKEELLGLGFAVDEDGAGAKIGGNCGNIYGFLEGERQLEPILFCSHMDTVEPSRGKRALLGSDDVIRSGGDTVLGADDCSGIAAILEVLRTIKEKGLKHRPIEVLFTVAEEVYCIGSRNFDFSKIRSKEAYVLDMSGTSGTAAYAAPTILSFTAKIHGRAAHAGFAPHKGIHAIKAGAEAVSKLDLGQIDSDTTLNVGMISGGRATNIVPELCTVVGEVRSYSHEKALGVADDVKRLFESTAAAVGAFGEFEIKIGCKAYETPKSHQVIRRFESACRELNLECSLIKTFGGSDNNIFAEHGITGVVLASAMFQCHSCEEYTTVGELIDTAELTMKIMISET